ncbi:MAG: two-component regulator propeller domain-containing protein [Ignavibacteria bacterium]
MSIYSLAFNSKGILWVGYKYGGLARHENNKWSIYTDKTSKLPDNMVFSLSIDKKDNLWIATNGHGLARFDGRNWDVYNSANSPLADDNLMYVLADCNSKWICTAEKGVFLFEE